MPLGITYQPVKFYYTGPIYVSLFLDNPHTLGPKHIQAPTLAHPHTHTLTLTCTRAPTLSIHHRQKKKCLVMII